MAKGNRQHDSRLREEKRKIMILLPLLGLLIAAPFFLSGIPVEQTGMFIGSGGYFSLLSVMSMLFFMIAAVFLMRRYWKH